MHVKSWLRYEQLAQNSQQVINEIEEEIVTNGESTLFVVSGITILVVVVSIPQPLLRLVSFLRQSK